MTRDMTNRNDDKLGIDARQLVTGIAPERDLWPGIEEAITAPKPRRWTPMFAQAAAVVLLVAASSMLTYVFVKDSQQPIVTVTPELLFEQASFGNRYNLGPGFQDARAALVAEYEAEIERLSPETRAEIETSLALVQKAIFDINQALEQEPENVLLQERLLRTYREELLLLRRVGGLTRDMMLRNDI